MPDLANRTQVEDSLTAIVAKLLSRQRVEFLQAIEEAPPEENDRRYGAIWLPMWRRLAEVLVIGLAIPLADIHRIGRRGLDRELGLGLDSDYGDALSLQWGVKRAKLAADLITANTRKMLEAANAKDLPSDVTRQEILRAATDRIFSAERAENIGITETTGAHSAGEFTARDMATHAGTGRTIYAHWQTAEDDLVCPICEPLNDQPEYVWVNRFPNGPPAHNRCRCFMDWRENSIGRTSRESVDADGRWVTIRGVHVFIGGDGTIEKGPAELVGKKPEDIGDDKPATRKTHVTDTKAFKEWFGDSKVVDEHGKPLVVYHGTGGEFASFDMSRANSAHVEATGVKMHFFTDNSPMASTYSAMHAKSSTMAVYLSIHNPLVIENHDWTDAMVEIGESLPTYRNDYELKLLKLKDEIYQHPEYEPTDHEMERLTAASKAADREILKDPKKYRELPRKPYKYDGIIMKNVMDATAMPPMGFDSYSPAGTVYAVFDPNQIKSATGNKGTFRKDSNDIREQAE